MSNELKTGLGIYLGEFYRYLKPTTKAMREYVDRGLSTSIVFVASRMVDAAEEMLASWRKNDNAGNGKVAPYLPVIFVATAKDYMPAMGDYSNQIGDDQYIVLPCDPKERIFKMREMAGDRRAQLVIVAADEPTARSIAAQFSLFVSRYAGRKFNAYYRFAGFDLPFPVQLETTDVPAMNIATEEKNITMLAIDITLRESIPLFSAPSKNEPNDGKGIMGSEADPCGYAGVNQVDSLNANTNVTRSTVE